MKNLIAKLVQSKSVPFGILLAAVVAFVLAIYGMTPEGAKKIHDLFGGDTAPVSSEVAPVDSGTAFVDSSF